MMQNFALGDLHKQSMTPGLWCLAGTLPRRQEPLDTQTKNGKLMGIVDCNCLLSIDHSNLSHFGMLLCPLQLLISRPQEVGSHMVPFNDMREM